MLICYWDCSFKEYEEWSDEFDFYRSYRCTHPKSETGLCELNNKWFSRKDECVLQ
jgi:hypothetical protein